MGQYYQIVNIDKEQFLDPQKFGDGLKLMEFSLGMCGTMTALATLLADGNGRGGGDLETSDQDKLVGSWAGDRIVIAGDYADNGNFGSGDTNLYQKAEDTYEDISSQILEALYHGDDYIRQKFDKVLSTDGYTPFCLKETLESLESVTG